MRVDYAKASGASRVNANASYSVSLKGIREYRVIEQVGHDILELEANALPDLDVFHDTKVHVPIRQTAGRSNSLISGVETENWRPG